jgi:hypothetical protein
VSGGSARTLAVARFLAADVFRSQRYLLPLLVYAAVLGALSGSEVTGALSSIYIVMFVAQALSSASSCS